LDALTRRVAEAPRIALDTEANSLHNYRERVCLIQLSAGDGHYIVDPLADIDLSTLLKHLGRSDLIFHGADYDLRLMRTTFDVKPKGDVFDTMLAAQLLGFERFGYAALVEQFFEKQISKAGQKSNWGRRPLTEAQLEYAADDTRYLGPLAELLREQLESKGRIAWHGEWCRRVVAAAAEPTVRDEDEVWRISGTGTLGRKPLEFVREVWQWREHQAERADVPPFKILGNAQLIELATWAAAHPEAELEQGPRLPRHFDTRRMQTLKTAIKRAHAAPKEKWPERLRRPPQVHTGPECKPQIEALRAESARIAGELGIPASVLAPKAMIVAIARNDARTRETMQASSGMMDWQVSLLEDPLRSVLEKFDGAAD
jgi:ribonuclease D